MSNNLGKPLVTIFMLTYNQEKYVRDSVRGLLMQTYSPLDIVISDDCSSDRTWDIILEEVEQYRKTDGRHNIILNRNDKNLGIALHTAKVGTYIHGILSIGNGGDDISFPNRVERIVSEWGNGGRTATVIFHDGIKIDTEGREIGTIGLRNVDCPLGACMAYATKVFEEFGEIKEADSFEDHINGRRAALLGDVLILKDKLIKYRVGSGVTSVLYNRRKPELRSAIGRAASYRQNLIDLDYAYSKGKVERDRYLKLQKKYKDCAYDAEKLVELIGSPSFIKRAKAYWALYVRFGLKTESVLKIPYLFPKIIGDAIYAIYGKYKYRK